MKIHKNIIHYVPLYQVNLNRIILNSLIVINVFHRVCVCVFKDDQLLPDELIRRQMAILYTTSRIDPKWYDSSSEFERRLAQVAQDWKLDPAILIANLNRVIEIVPRLTLYSFVKRFQDKSVFEISTKEWYWLLEFYMHMDSKYHLILFISMNMRLYFS